jgi:divalent metal cation (Fe/Co/Zn/Cd) transporter
MRSIDTFDLPPEKARDLNKARRLEMWTLIYIASSATFLGFTMGTSQAMQTSCFEDVLSAVPAAAFLIGYLMASLALVVMGAFLLIEAAMKLIATSAPRSAG